MFARLAETSDTALKTRERLFGELKSELEQHVELEQRHLFPILRRQPETKELVAAAVRENKDLRTKLNQLAALPKNDEAFLDQLTELQKAFRQHAQDEKRELLPAVQRGLSDEQVQGIVGKMETTLAEADQARQDQAEERRAAARLERAEREQEELQAEQEQEAIRRAKKATKVAVQATEAAVEAVAEGARDVARSINEGAQRVTEGALKAPSTGMFFWDMMLGMSGARRAAAIREQNAPTPSSRPAQEVIQLAEEVLVVGKRTVNTGTTSIRRFVVEKQVEQDVSLMREWVVIERRRPGTNKLTGEVLTELTIEVVETDEVPVVSKNLQLREEIVVHVKRTEHVKTVHETLRQDEVEIEHANARRPASTRT